MSFVSALSKGKKNKSEFSVEELQSLFGKEVKPPKEKVGALTRLGNVLSAFEPGGEIATFFRTGDIKKAGKQYVSEVGRGLGSLFSPLDPYTKPKELSEQREGFKEVSHIFGVSEKGPWDDLLGIAGDILLDPGNLFLTPAFKVAGKAGKGTGEGLFKTVKAFEPAKKITEKSIGVMEGLGKMFIPGFKQPGEYKTARQLYQNLLDYNKTKALEEGVSIAKKLPNEKSFVKVVDWIESGGKTTIDDELKPVAQRIKDAFEVMKQQEKSRGILKSEVSEYFPHIKKQEFKQVKVPFAKPVKASLGASKSRKIEGMVSEINDSMGREFFETNPALASTIRNLASKKAIGAYDFLESVKNLGPNVVSKVGTPDDFLEVPIKQLEGLKFHPEVAKDLTDFYQTLKNEDALNPALKAFDSVQNLWKRSVTVYFPAFHARNAFSNFFVNWLAGVKNPHTYKIAFDIAKGKTGSIAGRSYDETLDLAKQTGVFNKGLFGADIAETITEQAGKELSRGKWDKIRRVFGLSGKLGRGVENNARLALFIDQLGKDIDPLSASQTVKKFLFDYADLTPFEREVMKRVFPFYTWTRKAIPLMIEQLVKQPTKFKAVTDVVHNLQDNDLTDEEKSLIPDYITNSLGIQLGRTKQGTPKFLAGLGLPVEVFGRVGILGETAKGMLSPFIKFPAERMSGVNFFTDKQIKEDPFLYNTTKLWGNMPFLKNWLEAEKVDDKYYVNPERMHIFKTLLGRFVSTGEKLTKEDMTALEKFINALTGIRTYEPDLKTEKYFKEKEAYEETALPLIQKKKLKKFENYYVPKTGFMKHLQ